MEPGTLLWGIPLVTVVHSKPVMDKFIRDCILDHMERHNLFTTDQHGFIKGKSCATQLIEVLDNWTEQLDNL
jgi:hypothetical protein